MVEVSDVDQVGDELLQFHFQIGSDSFLTEALTSFRPRLTLQRSKDFRSFAL